MIAPTVVPMPRLSDSMEDGTILRWLKEHGDQVEVGDALVEIETDKATMVYEAEAAGTLHRLVAEGDRIPLGQPIAQLLSDGQLPTPTASAGVAPAELGPTSSFTAAVQGNGHGNPSGHETATTNRKGRIAASPVARRVAESLGINLGSLSGTGPHGRIVKRDVQAAAEASAPLAARDGGTTPSHDHATTSRDARGEVAQVQLTRVQATIARRMAESRATVPDFSVEVDVVADALVALREDLRGRIGSRPLPSYNDFIVKACAMALRAHPRVNGAYCDGHIEEYHRVNVGVAVAAEDALLVPVVTDADQKSLGSIAEETRRLAEHGRNGTLTPGDLSAGTFTVSNLGMFGVTRFSAVVNRPQAAIMAVGALERRAIVRDDQLMAAHVMTLTLCSDHRILYGADAAAFLDTVRRGLEDPLGLLL